MATVSETGAVGGKKITIEQFFAIEKQLKEKFEKGEIDRDEFNDSYDRLKCLYEKSENSAEVGSAASSETTKGGSQAGKYQVGAYQDIKGVDGMDAHHVGQKALMKKLVKNYDPNTAPAINVPKVGHTISGPNGIVSRSTKGITTARQLLARDLFELKRVYPDIPNSAFKELINMNKMMYPEMR